MNWHTQTLIFQNGWIGHLKPILWWDFPIDSFHEAGYSNFSSAVCHNLITEVGSSLNADRARTWLNDYWMRQFHLLPPCPPVPLGLLCTCPPGSRDHWGGKLMWWWMDFQLCTFTHCNYPSSTQLVYIPQTCWSLQNEIVHGLFVAPSDE